MKFQGRKIYAGKVKGQALVTSMGISFFGGVDPATGLVVEKDHELEGESISGKILVFPSGKGSTVGSYTLCLCTQHLISSSALITKRANLGRNRANVGTINLLYALRFRVDSFIIRLR